MIVAMVIDNVWATRKEEALNGLKLMVVRRVEETSGEQGSFVAVDCVGAGIGERVLVVEGSSARKALKNETCPVDAAIVGILDDKTEK